MVTRNLLEIGQCISIYSFAVRYPENLDGFSCQRNSQCFESLRRYLSIPHFQSFEVNHILRQSNASQSLITDTIITLFNTIIKTQMLKPTHILTLTQLIHSLISNRTILQIQLPQIFAILRISNIIKTFIGYHSPTHTQIQFLELLTVLTLH